MNKPLGKPIAYGRTAEIYSWGDEQVLKLFYDWFGMENIEYEKKIAEAVCATGLPVPTVGEIILANDRIGLIYERVEGNTMFQMMSQKPWNLIRYARRLAELHVEMHTNPIKADLPNQSLKLKNKINQADALTSRLREPTLEALSTLKGGDRLCHGDFHPMNILMSNRGETIIDWIDSSVGNPLADLARTTIITTGSLESGQISNPLQKLAVRIFHKTYLRYYFSLRPGGEREYTRWLPVVAAARLSENITELEQWLINQAETL